MPATSHHDSVIDGLHNGHHQHEFVTAPCGAGVEGADNSESGSVAWKSVGPRSFSLSSRSMVTRLFFS
jgi:hypothetical protein